MTLKTILSHADADIDQVARHLDALSPEQRTEETFALNRAEQRTLFRLAQAAPPLEFEHFVPRDVPAAVQVRHQGKNSLPLTAKHRLFEKRFSRPDDGSARLFGYNEAPSKKLVGPGYFVAVPTAHEPAWRPRGAIVVDYFQVPDESARMPPHWPRLVPNTRGLQRFVYHGTRDFMRRVSEHVSIGAAYKGERALDHYFVLVREPNPPAASATSN